MDSVNSIAVYIEVRSFLVTARFSVCVYLQEEMAVNIIHSTVHWYVMDNTQKWNTSLNRTPFPTPSSYHSCTHFNL